MTATRTPGITLNPAGHRIIDKEHRGVRIFARLGAVSDQEAEDRLHQEIAKVEAELHERANRRIRFSDCAAQYLFDSEARSLGQCEACAATTCLRRNART
jgi:hypothetical protein